MVEREFLNDKGHFHVHLWQTPSLHREAGTCIKHVGYSLSTASFSVGEGGCDGLEVGN